MNPKYMQNVKIEKKNLHNFKNIDHSNIIFPMCVALVDA